MRTLAFRVEYDGAQFNGFQRQRGLPTVQGLLEELLTPLLGHEVEAIGAGRTDSGVHAVGQVVHVNTSSTRPLDAVVHALWRMAHGRLAIPFAWEAPAWFHARHNARRRVYQYLVLRSQQPSPLLAARTWHVWRDLDVDRMRHEAATLLGRRDFRAFQAGGEASLNHFFRTLHRFEVHESQVVGASAAGDGARAAGDGAGAARDGASAARDGACAAGDGTSAAGDGEGASRDGSGRLSRAPHDHRSYLQRAVGASPLLCLEIEADAFLPHMVRMLVGTLIDVGSGLRPPGTMAQVLRTRDSRRSSAAAPPHGLCLVEVKYAQVVFEGPTGLKTETATKTIDYPN